MTRIGYGFFRKKIENECIYIKYVTRDEIQEIYDIRETVIYNRFEIEVIDEKEDMISIVAMTGDYRDWLNLRMECIDKGVYQKWIRKDEAEIKIIKVKL